MLSVVLGRAQFWVILGCLCLAQGNDNDCEDGLSEHDKNAICSKAVNVNGFCCDEGPADKGCQEMASTVKGSSAKCSSKNLCTFSKDGKTVYITSKDDPQQNTVKDCMKNVRIIDKPGGGGGSGGGDKDNKGGGGGNTPAPKGGGGGNPPASALLFPPPFLFFFLFFSTGVEHSDELN
uniref:Uncharacterized protein n=1 Tax=Cacopsylla melanoneura TaxID=428564 RepID=A0A8D8S464_9HEMI